MNRPATVVAATCAMALLAAGCTSSKGGDKHSESPSPTKQTSPVYSQHPLPPDKSITNSVTRRKQVAISSCSSVSGGWSASGTAKNPGPAKTTYTITVFFTTTTATVLDFAQTKVAVAPGQSAKWTAAARFSTPKDMRCVLRGVA